MSDKMYRQCLLRKETANGFLEDVFWIPNALAKKGNSLRVKLPTGEYEKGWVVSETYNARNIEDLDHYWDALRRFQYNLGK